MAARSFFGVYRVVDAPDHRYHLLQHGSTSHGRQEMPNATSCEPTGYYHPAGPIGEVLIRSSRRFERVALVGLGSGALACYAEPGARWTFYEIDPLIETIARDSRYFTYIQNSRAPMDVVVGDGRLTLQRAEPGSFELIVLDAFSSDAIPVHMLTREALDLYLSRLKPDGIVAVHISNRYLDLEPLIAALAEESKLFALAKLDGRVPEPDASKGRFPSHWVVLARSGETLAFLENQPGWRTPVVNPRVRPWTDDYSNILHVLTLQ
jgi:SAM-dependent methyltransferase